MSPFSQWSEPVHGATLRWKPATRFPATDGRTGNRDAVPARDGAVAGPESGTAAGCRIASESVEWHGHLRPCSGGSHRHRACRSQEGAHRLGRQRAVGGWPANNTGGSSLSRPQPGRELRRQGRLRHLRLESHASTRQVALGRRRLHPRKSQSSTRQEAARLAMPIPRRAWRMVFRS